MARDGDERAFRSLYERHTPRLLRFALQVTGDVDRALAEDVVQETWVRAVERLDGFEGRSKLITWLHGIALNVARETLRSARTPDEQWVERPDRETRHDHEGRIDLDRALGRMPEGRRMVLVLHDLQGYTHAEIADLLGIAVGTSKSQLHDARNELEEILTRGGTRHGTR